MTADREKKLYVVVALIAGVILAVGIFLLFGTGKDVSSDPVVFEPKGELHEVVILTPPGIGTLRTGLEDLHGNPVGVACSTCHADRAALVDKPMIEHAADLKEFHTELKFEHGTLTCSSCHHPDDRDQLRLSNGTEVAFADVMNLCAQCHGTQYRSYENGAHGGMTGYWDLSRGPRVRNNCVACHNPHAPAFPQLQPAPPPRDRFFNLTP